MATATRAKSASKPAAKQSQQKPVKDQDVQVTPEVQQALADLRTARHQKQLAERAESAAKQIIFAGLPKHKKSRRLILMHGRDVLAKVSWRNRKGIDSGLLMEGFPEAYEACETESNYQQIN